MLDLRCSSCDWTERHGCPECDDGFSDPEDTFDGGDEGPDDDVIHVETCARKVRQAVRSWQDTAGASGACDHGFWRGLLCGRMEALRDAVTAVRGDKGEDLGGFWGPADRAVTGLRFWATPPDVEGSPGRSWIEGYWREEADNIATNILRAVGASEVFNG